MKAIQTTFDWDIAQLTKSTVMTLCRWVGHKAMSSADLDPDGKPRFEQKLGAVKYEAWLKFYTPLCARGVNAVNG